MWGCSGEMSGRSLRLWSDSLSRRCMASTPFSFTMNGTNNWSNLYSHTRTHTQKHNMDVLTSVCHVSVSSHCHQSDYYELHHGAHVCRRLPTNWCNSASTNGWPGVHPLQEPAANQRPHSHVPQQAVPSGAIQRLGGQPGTASVWQSSEHGRGLLVHKQLDQGRMSNRRFSWPINHQKRLFSPHFIVKNQNNNVIYHHLTSEFNAVPIKALDASFWHTLNFSLLQYGQYISTF